MKEFNVPGQGGEITVTIQASQDLQLQFRLPGLLRNLISPDKKLRFLQAENDLDSLREADTIHFRLND